MAKRLIAHEWHGNVRELENAIKRALVMCSGQMLLPEHFDPITRRIEPSREPGNLDAQIYNLLQAHVQHAMEAETPPRRTLH